jgi:hypothetical protein
MIGVVGLLLLAAPESIAIVTSVVESSDASEASEASLLQDLVAELSFRLGVRAVAKQALESPHSEIPQAIRACGSDDGCVVARLEASDISAGLLAVLNLSSSHPLLSLRIVRRGGARAQLVEPVKPGERSMIRALAGRLFDRAGWPLAGRIAVETSPVDAKVTVLDASSAEPDLEGNVFKVPPGVVRVLAERDGYLREESSVHVTAGREERVILELKRQASLLESPWLWVIIGVAAAGAGAGAVAIGTNRAKSCFCIGPPCNPCP